MIRRATKIGTVNIWRILRLQIFERLRARRSMRHGLEATPLRDKFSRNWIVSRVIYREPGAPTISILVMFQIQHLVLIVAVKTEMSVAMHTLCILQSSEDQSAILCPLVIDKNHARTIAIGTWNVPPVDIRSRKIRLVGNNQAHRPIRLDY